MKAELVTRFTIISIATMLLGPLTFSCIVIPEHIQLHSVNATSDGVRVPPIFIRDSDNVHVEFVAEIDRDLTISRIIFVGEDQVQQFVCIIEIRDSEGITQFLEWKTGIATPSSESIVSAVWAPHMNETFEIRTIVLRSFEEPEMIDLPAFERLIVVDTPNPITIISEKQEYGHLDYVSLWGKVSSQYAKYGQPIEIRLYDQENSFYNKITTNVNDGGVFFATVFSEDVEIGNNTVVAFLPGREDESSKTSFTFGHAILTGVLDNLIPFDLHVGQNETYQIKYYAVGGNATAINARGSENYTIRVEMETNESGAFVIELPHDFLRKMTPLGDIDLFFFIDGVQVIPEQVDAKRGSGTFFAYIPKDTREIIVAARIV